MLGLSDAISISLLLGFVHFYSFFKNLKQLFFKENIRRRRRRRRRRRKETILLLLIMNKQRYFLIYSIEI